MNALAYDVVIIGGGIVGTATAREFLRRNSKLKLAIIEKEKKLAAHQSGHNSGVIHSGIYYTPGSLKAKLCVKGLDSAYKYCDEKDIPYKKCGKLIIAVEAKELSMLQTLYERGKENGVKDLILLDSKGIRDIEPNCQGLKAIWSPNTGIVDWAQVTKSYAEDCREKGASIYLNFCVNKFIISSDISKPDHYPVAVLGEKGVLHCKFVVTCAGLSSDKIAALSGCSSEPKIAPFRGDYLLLKPEKSDLVKTNIYPVPVPSLPFLGVHFTPRINGGVLLGPNAVLAFKREGYKLSDINFHDTYDLIKYKGFRKLARKHFSYGLRQMYERIFMNAQIQQLQKYVPKLQKSDVIRGPSGVRAQALSNDGNLVDDFVFDIGSESTRHRILHVRNAPSPAATSSMEIAKVIVKQAQEKFNLHLEISEY